MKQKKENSVALLLHWAGEQKFWLFLAILLSMCSGLCIIVPYIGIYRLMDATFNNACTKELVVQTVAMISAAVTLRFVLFGLMLSRLVDTFFSRTSWTMLLYAENHSISVA